MKDLRASLKTLFAPSSVHGTREHLDKALRSSNRGFEETYRHATSQAPPFQSRQESARSPSGKTESLFQTDITGSAEIQKQIQQSYPQPLKADEIIGARSKVPAVAAKKISEEGDLDTLQGQIGTKRKRGTGISHKELQRLRAIAYGRPQALEAQEGTAAYDPWALALDEDQSRSLPYLEPPRKVRERLAEDPCGTWGERAQAPRGHDRRLGGRCCLSGTRPLGLHLLRLRYRGEARRPTGVGLADSYVGLCQRTSRWGEEGGCALPC